MSSAALISVGSRGAALDRLKAADTETPGQLMRHHYLVAVFIRFAALLTLTVGHSPRCDHLPRGLPRHAGDDSAIMELSDTLDDSQLETSKHECYIHGVL